MVDGLYFAPSNVDTLNGTNPTALTVNLQRLKIKINVSMHVLSL